MKKRAENIKREDPLRAERLRVLASIADRGFVSAAMTCTTNRTMDAAYGPHSGFVCVNGVSYKTLVQATQDQDQLDELTGALVYDEGAGCLSVAFEGNRLDYKKLLKSMFVQDILEERAKNSVLFIIRGQGGSQKISSDVGTRHMLHSSGCAHEYRLEKRIHADQIIAILSPSEHMTFVQELFPQIHVVKVPLMVGLLKMPCRLSMMTFKNLPEAWKQVVVEIPDYESALQGFISGDFMQRHLSENPNAGIFTHVVRLGGCPLDVTYEKTVGLECAPDNQVLAKELLSSKEESPYLLFKRVSGSVHQFRTTMTHKDVVKLCLSLTVSGRRTKGPSYNEEAHRKASVAEAEKLKCIAFHPGFGGIRDLNLVTMNMSPQQMAELELNEAQRALISKISGGHYKSMNALMIGAQEQQSLRLKESKRDAAKACCPDLWSSEGREDVAGELGRALNEPGMAALMRQDFLKGGGTPSAWNAMLKELGGAASSQKAAVPRGFEGPGKKPAKVKAGKQKTAKPMVSGFHPGFLNASGGTKKKATQGKLSDSGKTPLVVDAHNQGVESWKLLELEPSKAALAKKKATGGKGSGSIMTSSGGKQGKGIQCAGKGLPEKGSKKEKKQTKKKKGFRVPAFGSGGLFGGY